MGSAPDSVPGRQGWPDLGSYLLLMAFFSLLQAQIVLDQLVPRGSDGTAGGPVPRCALTWATIPASHLKAALGQDLTLLNALIDL